MSQGKKSIFSKFLSISKQIQNKLRLCLLLVDCFYLTFVLHTEWCLGTHKAKERAISFSWHTLLPILFTIPINIIPDNNKKDLLWSLLYFSISPCLYPIQYLTISEHFIYWFVWTFITKYHDLGDLLEISLLTVLEAGKWKIKAQVDFVSCENSLPDLLPSGCVLTFFSYKTTDSIVRASPSWPKLTLITSQRPHFQIPSHWGFGILAEHKHSVHNNSIPDLGPPNRREITAEQIARLFDSITL